MAKSSESEDEMNDINIVNALKSEQKDIVELVKQDELPAGKVKFYGLFDDESICSDDSNNDPLPPIPDGGWGWVVVFSAFLVSACADGLTFSFGLLHEEFTQYFETTQSKTSLIGSLFIGIPLLAGPIMSALVDRYGCRVMTMIAGVLSTIGFLLASMSNYIAVLCLTFGFMTGLAMGILYVTSVVSVAFWFEKRRNLAVALASCGTGFGTFIYSPMTEYFLEIYDWRNTIVLLAGTLLNMCVCGAVMRNPEWLEIKQKRERNLLKSTSRKSSSTSSVSSRSAGGDNVYLDTDELKTLLKSGKCPEYILSTLAETIAEAEKLETTTQMNAEQAFRKMHSAVHLPTFLQHKEKVPREVIDKLINNKQISKIIQQNYPDLLVRIKSDIKPCGQGQEEIPKNKSHHHIAHKDHHTHSQSKNWLSRQLSTDHHYFKDMHLYRNTIMYRTAMMNIPRYKLKASSLPHIYRNSMSSIGSESDDEFRWYHHFWEKVKKTFDFKMFTEFHFLMFNLSTLIMSVWFIGPYFFLKSYMTERSTEGGAMMISIIGVASSIGIVALGWAGDQPWIHVTKTYAICLIICGLSVAAYPIFITNFWALAVISTIFGLSFASSFSYTPTILMELIPLDHFTMAYGLILLSQGIGQLLGPPIGGLLYDLTGSWDLTFYMSGFWLIISGLGIFIIVFTEDVRICGNAPLLRELEEMEKTENGTANTTV